MCFSLLVRCTDDFLCGLDFFQQNCFGNARVKDHVADMSPAEKRFALYKIAWRLWTGFAHLDKRMAAGRGQVPNCAASFIETLFPDIEAVDPVRDRPAAAGAPAPRGSALRASLDSHP